MRYFFIIFQIMICITIFWTSYFLLYIHSLQIDETTKYALYAWVIFLEFVFVISFIRVFYDTPIKKIEFAIKNFLVGNIGEVNKNLNPTLNKNLNYSIMFFKKTLWTLKNIKEEFIQGREIKWEVGLAKEIQGKMLSKKLTEVESLEMIFQSKPAWEIWGDSFDVIKQQDNYYIYVWDATGHGVWAGLIMTMVNALVSWFSKVYTSGSEILIKTNEILKPRVKANLLMSLLLIRWNEAEKRFFMTWAGHEYLIIYKQKTQKTYKIKSGGVALWMVKDISKVIKEVEIKVEPGDIIVLYSDGITEAINKPKRDGSEVIFWEERLLKAIENAPNVEWKKYKSARSVFNSITMVLSAFMWYNYTQLDDVTLWVIQYKTSDYKKEDDFPEKIDESSLTDWNW